MTPYPLRQSLFIAAAAIAYSWSASCPSLGPQLTPSLPLGEHGPGTAPQPPAIPCLMMPSEPSQRLTVAPRRKLLVKITSISTCRLTCLIKRAAFPVEFTDCFLKSELGRNGINDVVFDHVMMLSRKALAPGCNVLIPPGVFLWGQDSRGRVSSVQSNHWRAYACSCIHLEHYSSMYHSGNRMPSNVLLGVIKNQAVERLTFSRETSL